MKTCLLLLLWIVFAEGTLEDVNLKQDAFTSNSLPLDDRYMPSVGNGHLATNVFSTAVYMNGLYNGKKGESHRARIPAMCHIRFSDNAGSNSVNYTLDVKEGVFVVMYEDTDKTVEQRLYAHRFYTRAIINQFIVKSKNDNGVNVRLQQLPGETSKDIDFSPAANITLNGIAIRKMCGKTKQVEDERYQADKSPVCVYINDVPADITGGKDGTMYTFVMTVDSSDVVALKEMTDVLNLNPEKLYTNHTNEWIQHNSIGKITVNGDLKMSKIINGMWYYLSSSLPSTKSNQVQNKFFGLSPGGLSRGDLLKDYQGHSFWDTEIWMYPAILAFYPRLAEKLLEYRISNQIAAKEIATAFGNKGTRFPWESAFTGAEVTPDCCPEVVEFEQHITACIGFAISQYLAVTRDITWMKEKGCNMTRSIAEFWASRAELNPPTGLYDIKGVMGPDEDHSNVTNSVFTNVIAGKSLHLGKYAACICGEEFPPEWDTIARHLTILYDEDLDYNPQYNNYTRGTPIKQADVVLLDFPLLYKQNRSTTFNNLEYYESVTRENGPAMTWSMHTIGHLRLDDVERAARLYNRSYKPYVRDPFKIWTEAIEPEIGAVNFITGMGGFLQTLLFGYGGISIYLNRLEVFNPRLPPNTTSLNINEFQYLSASVSLDVSEKVTWLRIQNPNGNHPIVVEDEHSIVDIARLETIIFVQIAPNVRYKIRRSDELNPTCSPPAFKKFL